MRGSRKNRLRVPRETCVGVDVGSAVGRRGGREICEFFFLTFERTRACWSRAAICKNWRSEQTQNKQRSTVQLEKGNADRGRGSGSDWGSDRDRSSGAREPNCQKPWYRSQLTYIRARTERICSEERHFSLAIFLHSLMRANSIKSAKCLQKVYWKKWTSDRENNRFLKNGYTIKIDNNQQKNCMLWNIFKTI